MIKRCYIFKVCKVAKFDQSYESIIPENNKKELQANEVPLKMKHFFGWLIHIKPHPNRKVMLVDGLVFENR